MLCLTNGPGVGWIFHEFLMYFSPKLKIAREEKLNFKSPCDNAVSPASGCIFNYVNNSWKQKS